MQRLNANMLKGALDIRHYCDACIYANGHELSSYFIQSSPTMFVGRMAEFGVPELAPGGNVDFCEVGLTWKAHHPLE